LRYTNKFGKKNKWQVFTWYRIRDRTRFNIDDSESNFPLANNHFGLNTSLDYRLYKSNRSSTKLIYGNRDYRESNGQKLNFNSFGINTIFRNVFKREAGWHSYGIEATYLNKFFNQRELITDELNTFNWKEITSRLFYRYPITKDFDVTPSFKYKSRVDSNDDKFSYNQRKYSLLLEYKNNHTRLGITGSYIDRNHKTLEANDSNWDYLGLLEYKYFQLKLTGEEKLSKSLSLTLNSLIDNRISNKTNQKSIFFRSYEYSNVSGGLKYKF